MSIMGDVSKLDDAIEKMDSVPDLECPICGSTNCGHESSLVIYKLLYIERMRKVKSMTIKSPNHPLTNNE